MNESVVRNQNENKIAIWLIIIASAFLRFFNLGEMSLSNDELSALARLKYDSFSEMISKGVYIDFHPAGVQSFLFYWVKIFGDSPFTLRFPFVVAALISIWLIYRIGKKWYNELTGLLAASAFSFLGFTILFTQLARMYSPGIMFCLLTVFFFTDFISSTDKKKKNLAWWGWILSMSAALHMHYFSFVFVGLVGLSGIFLVRRTDRLKYLSGGIISLLTFIPEIPIFLAQIKTGDIGGWLGAPSKSFLKEFYFELFNGSGLVSIIVGLFFLAGFLYTPKRDRANKWRILSITWFFISFMIAYLYSIFYHPILMYSTMLFSTPFLLLFLFSFVPDYLLSRRISLITVLIFSLVLIYDTIVPGKYYSIKHFGVFKEIAGDAEGWSKKYGRDNVPFIINVIDAEYINYYFRRMGDSPIIVAEKIESPEGYSKLFKIVASSASPYFAFVWSNTSHPPEIPEIIRSTYPFLIERKNYFNAGSYLFGRKAGDSEVHTKLFSSACDFESTFWLMDTTKVSTEQHLSGTHSQKMVIDYGASFRKNISDIPGKGYRYVSFTAWVFPTEELEKAQMVISFDRDNKPFDYHGVYIPDFKLRKGEWQPVILTAELPKDFKADDILLAYIWNPSLKIFYIDDLKLEVHAGVDPYERFVRR